MQLSFMSPHTKNIYKVKNEAISNDFTSKNDIDSYLFLGVLFMLSLRFIVHALGLLFVQHSDELLLTTQGFSGKTTDAYSPSPVNVPIGNTLVYNVEKKANKNMIADSPQII